MKRYYEAKGEIRKKILDWEKRSQAALQEMLAFAKREGAETFCLSVGFGTSFYLEKQSQDVGAGMTKFLPLKNDDLWRLRHKDDSNAWTPRLSAKAGKTLHEEMQQIAAKHPSRDEITKAIGGDTNPVWEDGLRFFHPGFRIVGKRVLVIYAHPKFEPKDPAQLKRISDVEFERLTAEKKPRKKAKATA